MTGLFAVGVDRELVDKKQDEIYHRDHSVSWSGIVYDDVLKMMKEFEHNKKILNRAVFMVGHGHYLKTSWAATMGMPVEVIEVP